VFSKIIPRIYKITENKSVKTEEVSESAKILSSESNISISNIKGFIGLYVKVISFLLNHPAKVLVSAIVVLIAVNFSYTRIGSGVEFFPSVEPDLAKIVVFARGNLSVEEKKRICR
jgi:multidrug efflux pump